MNFIIDDKIMRKIEKKMNQDKQKKIKEIKTFKMERKNEFDFIEHLNEIENPFNIEAWQLLKDAFIYMNIEIQSLHQEIEKLRQRIK